MIENSEYHVPKTTGSVVGTIRISTRGTRQTGKKVKHEMEIIFDERVPVVSEQYVRQRHWSQGTGQECL